MWNTLVFKQHVFMSPPPFVWAAAEYVFDLSIHHLGDTVAEWLACWTQAQKGLGSSRSPAATLSGNSLRETVHTHRASVHQAAKLVAALFGVARVTAGLAKSNGSLPPGLWLMSPAGWLPKTGIGSGTHTLGNRVWAAFTFFAY